MTQTPIHRTLRRRPSRQRGVGVVVALLILVVLAALAAAMVRMNWGQQIGSAQDFQGSQASLAAGAGVEWGMSQALRAGGSWTTCASASQTLDLRAQTGFRVTVSCNSSLYVEGGAADGSAARTVRVFKIDAVACNSTGSCPDNTMATTVTYVERQRQMTAAIPVVE